MESHLNMYGVQRDALYLESTNLSIWANDSNLRLTFKFSFSLYGRAITNDAVKREACAFTAAPRCVTFSEFNAQLD